MPLHRRLSARIAHPVGQLPGWHGVGKSHGPDRCCARGALDAQARPRRTGGDHRLHPFVADRIGRELPDYAALWNFSTEDLSGFWSAIADYFEVAWHDQPTEVLPAAVCRARTGFPAQR